MKASLTTADYALIVSLFSVAISLASFVWNVWSKFIYPKGDVRVSFHQATITGPGIEPENRPMFMCVSASNYGPSEVEFYSVICIHREGLFKTTFSLLQPINDINEMPYRSTGPFGGGLPKQLKIGDRWSVYFPWTQNAVARGRLLKIGIADNFNRRHWAPRGEVKKVKAALEKQFGHIPYVNPHVAQ
ncbi:hypothetical protein ASD21_17980 [Caulobacter sp. Root1455]|uniref:hypothetical protein n=1 Tax=Caulobacter sp. Root1455 TaxID=1736465 RepID=UPI0006FD7C68|nr:hypothetical protein [Caulobacter sp. Root1455]KQZ05877.1 hypothetical protein ASD21_17980 [Caulobacter sp. Root1455]